MPTFTVEFDKEQQKELVELLNLVEPIEIREELKKRLLPFYVRNTLPDKFKKPVGRPRKDKDIKKQIMEKITEEDNDYESREDMILD
jgi:hypothetical protein